MTYALLGSGLGALAAVMTLALLLYKAQRDVIACRDMLAATREELSKTRGELEVEIAAHKVTKDELAREKDLRAATESERNDAVRQERARIVEEIHASDLAGAVDLGNRILSRPLPGVRLSETPGNELERP